MDKEYKSLTIPKIMWEKRTLTDSYGELVAQPLETGFGMTIGTALRRILLGGVEGCAVTSFILKGTNNEFAMVQGIVEDTMQIALNVKDIVVRNTSGIPGTMRLYKKGAGAVTVADIEPSEHFELINKDHVIAHLAEDGEIDVQFFVENGRGYQPAQWPIDKPYQEDGRIYLDAMFSPVRKVMFDVEKARVGKDIDFDKLTLRVHTDGSENPVDVVHYAVSVLRTQLEHFLTATEIPFNDISSQAQEVQKVISQNQIADSGLNAKIPADLLLKSIEDLELSVRAQNCLRNNGINRVIELVNLSEDDLLKIKNFGRKSLNEVKESVKTFGLHFGMNITEDEVKALLATDENKTNTI